MTRFTTFTDDELDLMEAAFGNEGLGHLTIEIQAEKKCRTFEATKAQINGTLLRNQLERLAMNSNYGMATKSCDDDEKLVVLCMMNKTLKEIYKTLEGMQSALERVEDKV